MTFYIKQHFFNWRDRYPIYDAEGNECFYVEGEIFTFGKKLHLYDRNHREIAFIRQRAAAFLPKFEIMKNGLQIAEVVKEFTFLRKEYSINGLGWKVHGDYFSHNYEIAAGSRCIARVEKKVFTIGDAYEINAVDDVDEVTILAVVLVIDACIDAAEQN